MGGRTSKKSHKLFLDAAEKGNTEAEFWVGYKLSTDEGVPEDKKKAFYWFMKSAEKVYDSAQYVVGSYYENGVCKDEESTP